MEKKINIGVVIGIILGITIFFALSPRVFSHELKDKNNKKILHCHLDQDSHIKGNRKELKKSPNLNPAENHALPNGRKIKEEHISHRYKDKFFKKLNVKFSKDHKLNDEKDKWKAYIIKDYEKKYNNEKDKNMKEKWKKLLEKLKKKEIKQISGPTYEYNCFGILYNKSIYVKPFDLKDIDFKEIRKEKDVRVCDYVLYYVNENISHVAHVVEVKDGKIVNVESKWGSRPFYRHAPDDLDPRFGKRKKYYRKPKEEGEGTEEKVYFQIPQNVFSGEFTLLFKVETEKGEPVEGATAEIESEIYQMLNEPTESAKTNGNGYAYLSFNIHPGLYSYRLKIYKKDSPVKIIWDQELFIRGVQY